MLNDPQTIHRFGDFELRVTERRILRRGKPIPAEPKVIAVIAYLVDHADRVVSKDELLDQLWPGLAVIDGVVHRCISRARRLVGDGDGSRRRIVTHGRRGYQFVAAVHSVRTTTGAGRPTDEAGGRFVGRSQELARIDRALHDLCEQNRGGILAITGEAGIGKSRIVEELLDEAERRNVRVLRGHCPEVPGATAFRPWLQILGALVSGTDGLDLVRELGVGAGDLAGLLPEVRAIRPDVPSVPALAPDQQRMRVLETAERLLRLAAQARPTLVVLDDLHGADEDTLSFLRLLVQQADRDGLLFAVAYRDEVARIRPSLAAIDADACRGDQHVRMELPPLSTTQTEALVAPLLDPETVSELVPAIHSRSQGNPFFARELALHLRDLVRANGLERVRLDLDHGAPALPTSIRSVLSLRSRSLSTTCVEVLENAAVLGRDFDLALLRACCDRDAHEVDAALDEACRAALVDAVAREPGRYHFRHVLIRDHLYEGIPPVSRMRRHHRAALEIQRLRPDASEACCEQLAWHYFVAAADGHVEEAVTRAVFAAERAKARFAFAEAALSRERAVQALRSSGYADRERCCRLLLEIADSWQRAGEDARAVAAFREAAEAARGLGDPTLLARAAIGTVVRFGQPIDFGSTCPESPELLEEALAALPPSPSTERALVLVCLSFLLYRSGERGRCIALLEEGERTARACGDPTALAIALFGKHTLALNPGDLATGADVAEDLIRVSNSSGLDEMLLLGHTFRVFRCLESAGNLRELEDALGERSRLAERIRQPQGIWWSHVLDATVAMMRGDWRRCDELSRRARDLASRSTNKNQELAFRSQQSQILLHRGEIGALVVLLRESCEMYPHLQVNHAAHAALVTALGSPDVGMAFAERWHGRDLRTALQATNWMLEATCLAEIASVIGDVELAASLRELLRPHRDHNIIVGQGLTYNGPVARVLALLAATLGLRDEAEREFDHALRRARSFGAEPWMARIQLARARMLRLHGQPGDLERSDALLVEARSIGHRTGGILIQLEAMNVEVLTPTAG